MHTPLSSCSPWRLQLPPAFFCASLILSQATDAQEIFWNELLERWGKGVAKPSVTSQVSLSPPLNWASPAASSPSLPLSKDVSGCLYAGVHQERAAGDSGQGRGEVE